MEKKKQKNETMTIGGLARLIKHESKKNQEEIARIVNNAFQDTQDLFVDRFGKIDKKFEKVDKNFEQVDKNFKEIHKKIDNISLNVVDVVRKEDFEKLDDRVVDLEELAGFPSEKN